MRRLVPIIVVFVLALAACASPGEDGTATTGPAGEGVTAPSSTEPAPDPPESSDEAGTTTTEQAEPSGPTSGRPVAPDFTLELGDGGTYTLSAGERPVYLVFWAEW